MNKLPICVLAVVAALCLPQFLFGEIAQPAFKLTETELLDVVRGNADVNDKVTACQELGHVGTAAAVAALKSLLLDPATPSELFHAARYGIENITSEEAPVAILDVAAKLKGKRLAGVAQSIGNMKIKSAVPVLRSILIDGFDRSAADAAAAALGKIATPDAKAALEQCGTKNVRALEARLEMALEQNDVAALTRLSEEIPADRPALADAALRGLVLCAPKDVAASKWEELARRDDKRRFALQLLRDLPANRKLAAAVGAVLPDLSDEARVELCAALGGCPKLKVEKALLALAKGQGKSGDHERLAALQTLCLRCDDRALPILRTMMDSENPETAGSARSIWLYFDGKQVDHEIAAMLKSSDAGMVSKACRMALDRHSRYCLPQLLKLCAGPESDLRDEAFKTVQSVAVEDDIPALLAGIRSNQDKPFVEMVFRVIRRTLHPDNSPLEIVKAEYGCFENGKLADVTDNLQGMVDNGARELTISNRLSGRSGFPDDPAPGSPKMLRVTLKSGDRIRELSGREGSPLVLSRKVLPDTVVKRLWAAYDGAKKDAAYRAVLLPQIVELVGDRRSYREMLDNMLEHRLADFGMAVNLSGPDTDYAYIREYLSAQMAATADKKRLEKCAAAYLGTLGEDARVDGGALVKFNELARLVTLPELREKLPALKSAVHDRMAELGEGFHAIFNGRDMEGWEAADDFWFVRNGILTGESSEGHLCKPNHHIKWKNTLADFDLIAEFRISEKANSGIQLRSKAPLLGDEGYQPDLDGGGNYPGFIYHPKQHLVGERGCRVVIAEDGSKQVERFAESADIIRHYHKCDWNTYRIRCVGRTITLWLNGIKACELEDARKDFLPDEGYITLQLHQGPPMTVEYRKVLLKERKD
ncbi:MAG: DUF1080 domain-containing protein [Kiritimatiellae bacterium]|nr:DUF1080 domain-containing protein [Kiritimatiellia bacterium]